MFTRPVKPVIETLGRVCDARWARNRPEVHAGEIDRYFAARSSRSSRKYFMAFDERGERQGFGELSIRPMHESCETTIA